MLIILIDDGSDASALNAVRVGRNWELADMIFVSLIELSVAARCRELERL